MFPNFFMPGAFAPPGMGGMPPGMPFMGQMSGQGGPMMGMQQANEGGPGVSGGGGGGGGRYGNDIRSRVCMKFMQSGTCNYGDNCKYAHVRDPREAGIMGQGGPQGDRGPRRGGRGGGPDDSDGGRGRNPTGQRKTRICDKFMTMGSCPYGDKCMFAHGMDELRPAMPREGPTMPEGPSSGPGSGPASASEPTSARAAGAQQAAGKPAAGAQADGGTAAAAPAPSKEVTFVDKVRALCGVLGIGNAAAAAAEKPLALQTAAMSLRNANAFRENPFADSVERYVQAVQPMEA